MYIDQCISYTYLHFYLQYICKYRWGHKEIVEYLVRNPNVDSNCSDSSGMTPLYRACRYALIIQCTHPSGGNYIKTNITSLHSCGHKDITESLLKGSNINPNCSEANGWTPLHWASEYVINWLYTCLCRGQLCTWYVQVGVSGYYQDPHWGAPRWPKLQRQ